MNMKRDYLLELLVRNPILKSCEKDIKASFNMITNCFKKGNKLLVAGNGGSCADADHIVGELMKSFKLKRKLDNDFKEKIIKISPNKGVIIAENLQKPLEAISLCGNDVLNTSIINDFKEGQEYIYAQKMIGYGKNNDVFLAISTSGNSKNVYNACVVAKAIGVKIIGLTGKDGGILSKIADISINVPERETFLIQEYHIPIYHCLCCMLEQEFFG